jgi:hypothetical protein
MHANIIGATPMDTSSELVWDSDRRATSISGNLTMPEGLDTDWSPSLLLATAAGASLLSTFIELAGRVHLPLVGLVTHQRIELDAHKEIAAVVITVCITVSSKAAASDAHTVWMRALREAAVLRALACRVAAEPRIVVDGDAACQCDEQRHERGA